MFEIFIEYFAENEIQKISGNETGNYENNEYLHISNNANAIFQQLSSQILLILSNYTSDNQYNILVTLKNSICVNLDANAKDSFKFHRHDYIEMIYVVKGELIYKIENKYSRYKAGDVCIINQNISHMEMPIGDVETLYFSLSTDFIKNIQKETSRKKGSSIKNFLNRNLMFTTDMDYLEFHPVTPKSDQNIASLCFHIFREMLEKKAGYHDLVSGIMKRIISSLEDPELYLCNNTHYAVNNTNGLFERTLAYIHNHPYKIERSELSDQLHYNGNYISEVFMEHTGVTMASYIRNICLQEASRLLLNTNLSITEIVSRLHYENRTTFYRLFQNKYGVSPREYRNNIQQNFPKC